MKLRQAGETIEERARLRCAIEVTLRAQETVPGIEDHETGVGFLERVLEIAESGVRRGYGTRRDGSTQDDEPRGISVEAGEARLNDLGGSVFRRGVQDVGWFELFAGERVAATGQRCRDGEGDPGLFLILAPRRTSLTYQRRACEATAIRRVGAGGRRDR